MSAAAVAGFAAVAIIPKKTAAAPSPKPAKPAPAEKEEEESQESSLWRRILGHAVKFGSKWAASSFVANMASKLKQEDDPDENGAAQTEQPAASQI